MRHTWLGGERIWQPGRTESTGSLIVSSMGGPSRKARCLTIAEADEDPLPDRSPARIIGQALQLDSRRQADIEELSPDTMRDKLAVFSTLLGAVLTFWAAVLMRD